MKRLIVISFSFLIAGLMCLAQAQVPMTGAGKGTPGGAPPPATTTWNPSDKTANVTLSNGNLTLATTANGYFGARTIASASSGKKYWELHLDAINNPASTTLGFGNATADLTNFLGVSDTNSVGWLGNGTIFAASTFEGGGFSSYATNDTISFALDITAKKAWFRTNSGNWNNDAGADPAAGTNGIDVSGLASFTLFPIGQGVQSGDAMTANFGATSYAQSVPSGYGNW